MRLIPLLLATASLAACATVPQPSAPAPPPRAPVQVQAPPPSQPPPRPVAGFRLPQILEGPGLAGVIREDRASLTRRFGVPRLDVVEGDMRKLQFTGSACVLDIFLYPLSPNGEPVATWLEARRESDGAAVDRASCIQSLSR